MSIWRNILWLALLPLFPAAAEEASTELETMTILGEPARLTRTVGSAHSIEPQTLEAFAHDDINRVLNWIPGLYVRGEDGFGLRPNIGLRGGNSDRSQKVTLLEDGVLFGPAPYAAPASYYFPLTVRMVGVEVFKGPAAIAQGPQTIGGAINLISAPLTGLDSGDFALAGGSDGYRRAQARLGGSAGGLRALLEGVHIGSDGFKALDGGGDTGFRKNEALLKLGHDLGPGQIEWRLGYADEVSDETYLGLTEADFRATPNRRYLASALDRFRSDWNGLRVDYEQAAFGGRWQITAYSHQFDRAWNKFNNFRGTDIRAVLANPQAPANRLNYEALTGQSDTNPDSADDDLLIGTNDRDFRSSGLQSRLRWGLAGGRFKHELEAGIRLHSDRIHRLHDELSYDVNNGQLVRNQVPRAITADNTGRAEALALWLRDEMVSGRWTLAPGLRIEAVRTTFQVRTISPALRNRETTTIVLPGFGVSFAQRPGLTWLAGVHRGFSPPAPGLAGDVEPEDAINGEAGLRWTGPLGRIELIGFYSDYRNLTAQCTFSAGCNDAQIGEQTNAGRVVVGGAEFSWSSDWGWGEIGLPVVLSYTFTRGEFRESFSSANPQFGAVEAGFELPYLPEHRANLLAGIEYRDYSAQLSLSAVSAMRDTAGRGAFSDGSDGHAVLDLALGWDLNRRLALSGRIDNLLDREYVAARRPFGARPGKPLSIQLGVEYRY